MSLNFSDAQAAIAAGMNAEQAHDFLELLMSGALSESEGAQLLVQLAERGETPEEVAAFVRGLQAKAVQIPVTTPSLDVCGTGGSGLTRYNVSTTVAFICAAAGIPVAKHGNRGSKRPNGSFDVLEALDIPFGLEPEHIAAAHAETNIALLFARSVHPAVGAVVPYRKAAGRRTIFNLAGPLANPLPLKAQIVGTVDPAIADLIATTLRELGGQRAWVVRGEPGIDELSVVGSSTVWMADGCSADKDVQEAMLDGAPFAHLTHDDLPGGDAPVNAALFQRLVAGESGDDDGFAALRAMVVANAGLAIDCWHQRQPALHGEGAQQADELLASGAVAAHVQKYREVVQALTA